MALGLGGSEIALFPPSKSKSARTLRRLASGRLVPAPVHADGTVSTHIGDWLPGNPVNVLTCHYKRLEILHSGRLLWRLCSLPFLLPSVNRACSALFIVVNFAGYPGVWLSLTCLELSFFLLSCVCLLS